MKKQPENYKHLYHPEFAEQVWVRPYKDGKWGKAFAVTDAKQDIARCAIVATNNNRIWVFYSANRKELRYLRENLRASGVGSRTRR